MNFRNRLKRMERETNNSDVCRCYTENIATSKMAFTTPQNCADCRGIIKPAVLVVGDLSEIEDFSYPVKVYAGFDANLV